MGNPAPASHWLSWVTRQPLNKSLQRRQWMHWLASTGAGSLHWSWSSPKPSDWERTVQRKNDSPWESVVSRRMTGWRKGWNITWLLQPHTCSSSVLLAGAGALLSVFAFLILIRASAIFYPFKNLVLALLILQLPIRLRKQMPQKQAASESSFEPDSVRVIIAQGQSGTSRSVSAVRMFLVWADGSEWLSTNGCWEEGKLCLLCLSTSQRSAGGPSEGKLGAYLWVVAD